jgi:cell division septation protein DedD
MGMFYGRGTEFQEKGYKELLSLFYEDQKKSNIPAKTGGPHDDRVPDKKQSSQDDVLPELKKDVVQWLADPTPPPKPAPQPKPAPEPKPIPKPEPKPKPKPAPEPQHYGAFTVQVAATKDEVEARTTVDDLISKGFDAYFYRTMVDNRHFYRVRVGNLDTREQAVELVYKLEASGYPKGYIARMTQE